MSHPCISVMGTPSTSCWKQTNETNTNQHAQRAETYGKYLVWRYKNITMVKSQTVAFLHWYYVTGYVESKRIIAWIPVSKHDDGTVNCCDLSSPEPPRCEAGKVWVGKELGLGCIRVMLRLGDCRSMTTYINKNRPRQNEVRVGVR